MEQSARPEAYFWRLLFGVFGGGILLAHLGLWWAARSRWSLLWPPSPAMRWTLLTLALLAVAAVLYRRRRFGAGFLLLQLLVLDLAFGFTTRFLEGRGVMQSFFPSFRAGRSFDFEYHPLLQGRPKPNASGSFLMFGQQVNWAHDKHGYRRSRPVDPGKPTVAVIGGSTTYDTGNSNDTMWVHRLEEHHPDLQFLNLGVPGYSTVEHVIQTTYYLPEMPRVDCAVYYVGWNDIRSSHLPNLDPAYADFHLLMQPGMLGLRNAWEPGSPILTLVGNKFVNALSMVPMPPRYPPAMAKSGVDPRLVKHFARNLQTIALLNQQRGLRMMLVGQVLNFEGMTSPLPSSWMPLASERDTKAIMTEFNRVLRETADRHKVPWFQPDQSQFHQEDFADNGHFNPTGARKFAGFVQAPIRQACFPPTN